MGAADDRKEAIMKAAHAIVDKYCDFKFYVDSPMKMEENQGMGCMSTPVMYCHYASSSWNLDIQLLKEMVVEYFGAGSISY